MPKFSMSCWGFHTTQYDLNSFDDPLFVNYLTLNGLKKEYEFECADIPQGIVFIQKQSDVTGSISAIEILK